MSSSRRIGRKFRVSEASLIIKNLNLLASFKRE